ncbi:MAG TPA: tRNA (cytidine(34)-2'-O)-methyltransferase [Alphaproteobacteria bacterium]|nr:tRNA (cytidine(34)-2'-O)-methyltransferase [Alphaproteobacteria bacterium]
MRLVLYEPDIPQNAGTMMRLAACLGVAVELIEPCGFVFSDRHLRRAGMDYLEHVTLTRHSSFSRFEAWRHDQAPGARLLLLTTKGEVAYQNFVYDFDDLIMVGRESAGVPDAVHASADARLRITLVPGLRSLNVAAAAAMVLGEALRQTGMLPPRAGR